MSLDYWNTHTGLDGPGRDPTYDSLPILLGIEPDNGPPEAWVTSVEQAKVVFAANSDLAILAVFALKAHLLAAKLNANMIPEFADVQFASGAVLSTGGLITTFGDAIAAGDQLLDDAASSAPFRNSDAVTVKNLLDAANNGCPTPTPSPDSPTPTAAGAFAGPTVVPSALPDTGNPPGLKGSGLWAVGIALALLTIGALGLNIARRRES